MLLGKKNREEPDLNMTPLIDVVFLLLIFFMVSTSFDRDAELNIELPQASGKTSPTKKFTLEISIDSQGRYFINKKRVKNEKITTLMSAIELTLGNHKDVKLIISADRKTPHEAVIRAMDAASKMGLKNLTFSARQKAE
jgi:biopolymer transport protein ExbD